MKKNDRKTNLISILVFTLSIVTLLSACSPASQNTDSAVQNAQELAAEIAVDTGNNTPEPRALTEGEAVAASFAELQTAAQDTAVNTIYVDSDLSIDEDFLFERNNDLAIFISQGVTVTVNAGFTPVFCTMTNDGTIIINGTFDHACNLVNNGTVTVKNGGTASSGMTSITNNGDFSVEEGGSLLIERGTQFLNTGSTTNGGHISVGDGGSLDNQSGSITNNGTIDISSYFEGDLEAITGTGTVNDNRE